MNDVWVVYWSGCEECFGRNDGPVAASTSRGGALGVAWALFDEYRNKTGGGYSDRDDGWDLTSERSGIRVTKVVVT